jgi:Uma2 family endonuclease
MSERLTVYDYFAGPEEMRPQELVYGIVREPPAPRYGHQTVVTRTTVALVEYVRTRDLGTVCVSPVDVVLDREQALVVQPDIVFVSTARAHLIREQIWGAPDLVVEVLSPQTAVRDRTLKLSWYRRYGVRECWFLDPRKDEVEIVYLDRRSGTPRRRFRGETPLQSGILPDFTIRAGELFKW